MEAHVVSLSGLGGLISGLSAAEDSTGRSEPQEGVDMSSLVLWSMRCYRLRQMAFDAVAIIIMTAVTASHINLLLISLS